MPVQIETIVETLNQHRTSLVGYAWVVVGDAQLADDVYQDVSLAAIRKADQIDGKDHLIPWLRQAIRLRGLELRRNRSRHGTLLPPEVLDLFETAQTDLTGANETERMTSLRKCLESMPNQTKNLLKLRYTHTTSSPHRSQKKPARPTRPSTKPSNASTSYWPTASASGSRPWG